MIQYTNKVNQVLVISNDYQQQWFHQGGGANVASSSVCSLQENVALYGSEWVSSLSSHSIHN